MHERTSVFGRMGGRIVLLLAALSLAGCIHQSVPSDDQLADTTAKLANILPTLSALRVRSFNDQDWCRVIDDARGNFTNLPDSDTCDFVDILDRKPVAFDDKATDDWRQVRQAFRDAGVSVEAIAGIQYDADGSITRAEFDMKAGMYDRFEYLFDPNHEMDHEDNPDTIVNQQIDDTWWFVSEDWN
jgi:hypothetical protein